MARKPWYARKRLQRKAIGLIVSLVIVGVGYYTEARTTPELPVTTPGYYRVVRADDGDTIVVDMAGAEETIRFIGVDTPEVHDPRKAVQCYGKAASDYTATRVNGATVRLETDPLSSNRDRYNRLLRYVYLPDGTLLNQSLIHDGYAFAYLSFPFTKSDDFAAAQTNAREQNRGLWSSCDPQPNQYGGFTSNNQ